MQMNLCLVKENLFAAFSKQIFFIDFNEQGKLNIPIWWENFKACIKRKILCYSSKTNRCDGTKKLSYEDVTQIITKDGKSFITVLVKDSALAKREKYAFQISRVEYIKFHLKQIICSYILPWKIKTTHAPPNINASLRSELLKTLFPSV